MGKDFCSGWYYIPGCGEELVGWCVDVCWGSGTFVVEERLYKNLDGLTQFKLQLPLLRLNVPLDQCASENLGRKSRTDARWHKRSPRWKTVQETQHESAPDLSYIVFLPPASIGDFGRGSFGLQGGGSGCARFE